MKMEDYVVTKKDQKTVVAYFKALF